MFSGYSWSSIWPGREPKLRFRLSKITYHRNESQVTFLLQVGFDRRITPTCRFSDGLDEQTFTDTKLYANIIGTELRSEFSSRHAMTIKNHLLD
jgi:hypothetical protein